MRCLASIVLVLLLCPIAHAFLYGTQEVDVTYTYEKEHSRGDTTLNNGVSNDVHMEMWVDNLGETAENKYFPMWIHFQYQDIESWWSMKCGAIGSENSYGFKNIKFICIGNSANPEWSEINDGGIGYIYGKMVVKTDRVILKGTFKGIAPGLYKFGYPVSLKLMSTE